MAEPTTYIVLERSVDQATSDSTPFESWHQLGTVPARSGEAAIREAVKADGTYVAIPARSWKPVTVRAETVTTLRIEEAT